MTQTPATPPTVIDVSGLPEPVVRNIRELVDALREKPADAPPPGQAREPLIGRFARPGLTIPKELIDEAQRELWGLESPVAPRDGEDKP